MEQQAAAEKLEQQAAAEAERVEQQAAAEAETAPGATGNNSSKGRDGGAAGSSSGSVAQASSICHSTAAGGSTLHCTRTKLRLIHELTHSHPTQSRLAHPQNTAAPDDSCRTGDSNAARKRTRQHQRPPRWQ